jgi:hypothetical protein
MNTRQIKQIEDTQLIEEMIVCKDALDGMRKADFFCFYEDINGRPRTLFLDNLQHFPFDVQREIKILLLDAIEFYNTQLNTQKNEQ